MMHPHTALRFIDPEIGLGVVATAAIPKGTITWARDPLDITLRSEDVTSLPPLMRGTVETYSFLDPRGAAVLCWDHGRFVNHSCEPNCSNTGYDFEVAIRDIAVGEQLTDDYGRLRTATGFVCRCESARCRGTIHGDGSDVERYWELWDGEVRDAFAQLGAVEQLLWPLVSAEDRESIARVSDGRAAVLSCRLR